MTSDDTKLEGLLAGESIKWGNLEAVGEPVTVTYSFSQSLPDYLVSADLVEFAALNFTPLNPAMEAAARSTLDAWAEVSGINFEEVDSSIGGEIRWSALDFDDAAGFAYYPERTAEDPSVHTDYSGDIYISSAFSYNLAPVSGGYGYFTFLHEIGHAIGLKHPFDEPVVPPSFDSTSHTVMSYTFGDVFYPSTLGWLDIHAAQYLYGVPGSGSHGNTAWGSETAESYIAPDSITRYLANDGDDFVIMGAGDDIVLGLGGSDTVSGGAGSDLLYGGADADSLYGGSDNDTLSGGLGDDTLSGGDGADVLSGGSGADLARFDAAAAQETGRILRDGGVVTFEGNDTIDGVELLLFQDGEIALTFDRVTDTANFDEGRYLALNPDVADAVAAGSLTSGYVHYLAFGQDEGRTVGSSYNFDEAFYLDTNPAVEAAISAGVFASGEAHFELFGKSEGRDPNALFDAGYYLEQNPDVAAGAASGDFSYAYDHFEAFGGTEGRDPSAVFDSARYRAENPDVADAGVNPLEHYLSYGLYEGRAAYAALDYFV